MLRGDAVSCEGVLARVAAALLIVKLELDTRVARAEATDGVMVVDDIVDNRL